MREPLQLNELKVGDIVIAGWMYHCEIIEISNTNIIVKYPISGWCDIVEPTKTPVLLVSRNEGEIT